MPVTLDTCEDEIGRMTDRGQPQKKKKLLHRHLNGKKLGMVAHICHPSKVGEA
jgi:hypothetical protein